MEALKLFFGKVWQSWISMLGAAITTVSSVMIIFASLLSLSETHRSPYSDLIVFTFFPAAFVFGLLLIPTGIFIENRRKKSKTAKPNSFIIDFGNPVHRNGVIFFVMVTFVNSVILSLAFYKGYHFTESVSFCGKLCHTVMEPEYTAYQRSPHAHVACTECHIGGGASWFVKSKLSGLRQVYAVMVGNYARPIPTPIEDLRPARDTCEQCHWPQVFHGKKLKVFKKLGEDSTPENPIITAILLDIGGLNAKTGKYQGIHWHVSSENKVEYIASDKNRMQIKRVRTTDPKTGEITEYVNKDLPEPPEKAEWRTMDCIDCHNRPTHIYELPEEAVYTAVINEKIPFSLPNIVKVALEAAKGEYESREAAEKGIEARLFEYYKKNHPETASGSETEIRKAAAEIFDIYSRNVFPKMKVTFGAYPDHLGHTKWPGCFRCHEGEHESPSGKVVSQDCDNCHGIMVEDGSLSDISDEIKELIF